MEERFCEINAYVLLFNDGELIASYWRIHHANSNDPWDVGQISVIFKGDEFPIYNQVVNGRLTPDSLSFWVLGYENNIDTCFYVGVKI